MKLALINPAWTFEGSIYFGCREPHLPLELGYAQALLEAAGHEVCLLDAQLEGMTLATLRQRVQQFEPDISVVTTAPSYLFWRCPPPELKVPLETFAALDGVAGLRVAVGPHASTTPRAVLNKLALDAVVVGECEQALLELANAEGDFARVGGLLWRDRNTGRLATTAGKRAADMAALPALRWPRRMVEAHRHHHHRFDRPPRGPGAELEASRGCPYACTFCAKQNFRDKFRRRPLQVVLSELDGLIEQGAEYVYFVDEIFLPERALLESLVERPVQFGVQMRIDLFDHSTLELLGRAGCVSIEAGIESVSEQGRSLLAKRCKRSTPELVDLLVTAKRHVPFVQANLLLSSADDPAALASFRQQMQAAGVWTNDPVPLFPYPGSPAYGARWGVPDDQAWERAHAHYLGEFDSFSEIQECRPLPLSELERSAHA